MIPQRCPPDFISDNNNVTIYFTLVIVEIKQMCNHLNQLHLQIQISHKLHLYCAKTW